MPPSNRTGRRRAIRRIVAVAIGAATGAAAFAGVSLATGPHRDDDHAASPPALVQRPGCAWSRGHDDPGATPDGDLAQEVAVTVRPTALVRVDGAGRVVAAWTNTGCAPRRTDDVYVEGPDGTIRPGRSGLVDRRWVGDFREPGVAAAQPIDG